MKALIDPTQDNRIVQVETETFPVSDPYFWIECPENITPSTHVYKNSKFEEIKRDAFARLIRDCC